jgi:hypothetical protein
MRWQEFTRLEHRRLDERREGMLRRALGDPLPGETIEQLERIVELDRIRAGRGAWAPPANSSGNLARWSSLRRDGAPGGGLCLKASTPSSLARFIHWLTAPSLTPRASAISVCFQPRSFNSKSRKRLPSRQLVACWLDSVFSIVGVVIPMSLDLYAYICKGRRDPHHERGRRTACRLSRARHSRRSTWAFDNVMRGTAVFTSCRLIPSVPHSRGVPSERSWGVLLACLQAHDLAV